MEKAPINLSQENIMLIDGHMVRQFQDTDFNIIHQSSAAPNIFSPKFYIPEGEIWVDHCFADEVEFLLQADRAIDEIHAESRAELIAMLKQKGFIPAGPPPPFVMRREIRDALTVCLIDGKTVRRHIDPEFVLGGHDLVYPYTPAGEIWIEEKMDPREIPFVLTHEWEERKLMSTGATYDAAHEYALVMERMHRRREGAAYPGERNYPFYGLPPQEIIKKFYVGRLLRERPVTVQHYPQSPAMCGPASLRIALSAFGKEKSEEELVALAQASAEHGTEHVGLLAAARSVGAMVIEKEEGTLAEIEELVRHHHLPVIVGWFDRDGDHYSVVTDVTPQHVILADPAWDTPERFVRREHFEEVWFDFVGPGNAITSWKWYMAIAFPKEIPSEDEGNLTLPKASPRITAP